MVYLFVDKLVLPQYRRRVTTCTWKLDPAISYLVFHGQALALTVPRGYGDPAFTLVHL